MMTFNVRSLEVDDYDNYLVDGGMIGGGKHQQKISFLVMVLGV